MCVKKRESGIEEKVRRADREAVVESPVFLRSFNRVIKGLHLVSCRRNALRDQHLLSEKTGSHFELRFLRKYHLQ